MAKKQHVIRVAPEHKTSDEKLAAMRTQYQKRAALLHELDGHTGECKRVKGEIETVESTIFEMIDESDKDFLPMGEDSDARDS